MTKKKLSNDENIRNLKTRKQLRIVIIVFCLLTILLAIANLFFDVPIVFAIITFVIYFLLNKKREKIVINLKEDSELKEIRKEIDKTNKKYKKK
jgi:predicted membrane protein